MKYNLLAISTLTFTLFFILSARAETVPCGVQGDVFTTSTGRKIYLNFASHEAKKVAEGIRNEIIKNDKGNESDEDLPSLLKAGQAVIDATTKYSDMAKKGKITWIGAELAPEEWQHLSSPIVRANRYVTVLKRYLADGLSKEDAKKATALFVGINEMLMSWLPSDTKVVLRPLEDAKIKSQDIENMNSIYDSFSKLPIAGEQFDELSHRLMKAYNDDDPKAFKSAEQDIAGYHGNGSEPLNQLLQQTRVGMASFAARNREMVANALAQTDGVGLINVGSAHQRGIEELLNASCDSHNQSKPSGKVK